MEFQIVQAFFMLGFVAMAAGALWFFMERNDLKPELRPVATYAAVIAFVAAVLYYVMTTVVQFPLGDIGVEAIRDTVELRYWFEGTEVPGFQLEGWTPDGLHWVSPADIVDDQDLVARQAPRLVLRRPMDVTRGDLVVEFDFVEPHGVATERLVLASVAGFHLALRTGEGEARSEWAVSTEGPAEALADLRSNPERISGRLLDAGGTYRLRIEVSQQTGRMLVLMGSLDPRGDDVEYREIVQDRLSPPRGRLGSAGVSLRAMESLRLSSIWVRGER